MSLRKKDRRRQIIMGLLFGVLCSGCYGARLEALERALADLATGLQIINPRPGKEPIAIPRLASSEARLTKLETDLDALASATLCKDPRVRLFLKDCHSSNGCRTDHFEVNLSYMIDQPHMMAYLDPRQGVKSLTDRRRGQLVRLTEQQVLLSSSTLLVVTMAAGGLTSSEDEVIKHARELRKLVLETHPKLNTVRILPAQTIGCNNTTKRYPIQFAKLNPADRAEAPEPTAKQPQVIAWVFLVNC